MKNKFEATDRTFALLLSLAHFIWIIHIHYQLLNVLLLLTFLTVIILISVMRLITSNKRRRRRRMKKCCAKQQKILQLLAYPLLVYVFRSFGCCFYVFSFYLFLSSLFFSVNDAKHAIAIKSVDITLTHLATRICYEFFVPFEWFFHRTHTACYHRVINYSNNSKSSMFSINSFHSFSLIHNVYMSHNDGCF